MKIIFLIFIPIIFYVSCQPSKQTVVKTIADKPVSTGLNGKWLLHMLFGSENNWPRAPFIDINLRDKTFVGNSSCNTINGKFTFSGSYIAFDKQITQTEIACGGNHEKAFLSALLKINSYTINKDELELGQGEIVLMKFKRQ